MTTATISKVGSALKALRKNTWVSSDKIKSLTGESDLRSVRRLREAGYKIESRRTSAGYQFRRTN